MTELAVNPWGFCIIKSEPWANFVLCKTKGICLLIAVFASKLHSGWSLRRPSLWETALIAMHYLGDLVPESSRLRLASAFCKIGGLSGVCGMWVWAVISLVHSYREHSSARFSTLLRQSVGVRVWLWNGRKHTKFGRLWHRFQYSTEYFFLGSDIFILNLFPTLLDPHVCFVFHSTHRAF